VQIHAFPYCVPESRRVHKPVRTLNLQL